jgi:hypothetical protein
MHTRLRAEDVVGALVGDLEDGFLEGDLAGGGFAVACGVGGVVFQDVGAVASSCAEGFVHLEQGIREIPRFCAARTGSEFEHTW